MRSRWHNGTCFVRYFFDIHLDGQTFLDDRGAEFTSLEEAREHVLAGARMYMVEGSLPERELLV